MAIEYTVRGQLEAMSQNESLSELIGYLENVVSVRVQGYTNPNLVIEDIVQTTFCKALERASSYCSPDGSSDSFRRWLTRIAINETSNYYRAWLKHPPTSPLLNEHDSGWTDETEKEEELQHQRYLVLTYLTVLTPYQQRCLLGKWNGIPYDQLAELEGRSYNSLRINTSTAIRRMRQRLHPQFT
jgi:RNA polymerase sigma factor (sigma-70 family)